MPYIGNTIRAADDYRLIDDISSSFNGSTTSFALQVAGSSPVPFPKSPQQVLISVNGVIQEPDPTGSSGFNLVGTNIVFSSAPTNGHAFFGIIYATADYLNSGGNFPAGSVGAPSLTFIGDENTGIYRKGSGSVGFVADATEIANTDSNGLTISSGNLILGDSSGASDDRIKLGASGDLEIYHSGSHSFISNTTGTLQLENAGNVTITKGGTENMARFLADGAVELYFDNAKKAETVTGGFTITGVCTATSFAGDGSSLSGINTDLVSDTSPQLGGNLDVNTKNILFGDSGGTTDDRLVFGASSDLQIYHNGNESKIEETGTGNLRINTSALLINNQAQNETIAQFLADGAVELYHNNSKKFETSSGGCTVTGTLSTSGTGNVNLSAGAGAIVVNSGGDIRLNSASWTGDYAGKIQHSNNFLYFQGGTGLYAFIFRDPGGANRLYIDENGHVLPADDNSYDLGSTSKRWRNIYTNDLQLSNKGSSNDVDSTWGDYTIQEGFEDLYLINNRTGKKFKFNLTEVA